jgi:hypothetical protein
VVLAKAPVRLSLPVMPSDGKMAMTPTRGGLRVAGQVELAAVNAAPDWRRAELLAGFARRMFPALDAGATAGVDAEAASPTSRWLGHRPSTPDGLPVIGPSPAHPDVLHAFGHGHVGLAAAPAEGAAAPADQRACVRALVIGIDAYAAPPNGPGSLDNAVADATAVHKALSALPGAASTLLTDCSKTVLEQALVDFRDSTGKCKDRGMKVTAAAPAAAEASSRVLGIVFFAGHGLQVLDARTHFGHTRGELLGEEASVVSHHRPITPNARHRVGAPEIGRGLSHPIQVGKGEVFGDDGPPAVGPKLNGSHSLWRPWEPKSEADSSLKPQASSLKRPASIAGWPQAGWAAAVSMRSGRVFRAMFRVWA